MLLFPRLVPPAAVALRALGLTLSIGLIGCDTGVPPQKSIEVAIRGVHAAALADDGQLAVIGSMHHGGSLWRTADGERLFDWNHAAAEDTVLLTTDISADGQWAVTADVATLVLWDTSLGSAERFWATPGKIVDVSLDSSGQRALLGLATEMAVVFDIQRGGILHSLRHGAPVTSVALSRDGRTALTGAEDERARVWDLASGQVISQTDHDDAVQLVALSPDGTLALSVSKYDKALLWHTTDGSILGEIPLGAEKLKRGLRFTAAAISADNRLLLTGRTDNKVELWDIATLQKLAQWHLPKRESWQPSGAAVLDVAFDTETTRYWAVASNGFIHQLSAAETKEPGS